MRKDPVPAAAANVECRSVPRIDEAVHVAAECANNLVRKALYNFHKGPPCVQSIVPEGVMPAKAGN